MKRHSTLTEWSHNPAHASTAKGSSPTTGAMSRFKGFTLNEENLTRDEITHRKDCRWPTTALWSRKSREMETIPHISGKYAMTMSDLRPRNILVEYKFDKSGDNRNDENSRFREHFGYRFIFGKNRSCIPARSFNTTKRSYRLRFPINSQQHLIYCWISGPTRCQSRWLTLPVCWTIEEAIGIGDYWQSESEKWLGGICKLRGKNVVCCPKARLGC